MMSRRKLLLPSLMSIVPLFLIILNIYDFIDLFKGKDAYPFGSDFVSTYSIYRSETIYIAYNALFTIVLLFMIYYAFKPKRKLYIIFLFSATILFFYPIITASH